MPDEEEHAFINDLLRPIGTYLYGRRMYEVMIGWETDPTLAEQSPVMRGFAQIWQAAEKVVDSRTLERAATARTRIARDFAAADVRELKARADRNLIVAGPELAAQAIRTGLVDAYHLFVAPIILGDGTPALPRDAQVPLELVSQRRFGNGVVYLHYRLAHGE